MPPICAARTRKSCLLQPPSFASCSSASSSLFTSSPSPTMKRSINGVIGSAFIAAVPPAMTIGSRFGLSSLLSGIPPIFSMSSTVVKAIS